MGKSNVIKKTSEPVLLHVISDSTGNLAAHMTAALLTQFPTGTFEVRHWNFQTRESVKSSMTQIVQKAGSKGVAVVHAVVDPVLKKSISRACNRFKIPCRDLTGDFVAFLADASKTKPVASIKRLHEVSDDYLRRIDAMEFTMAHDDGLGLDTISKADVVLVGISRTSKSPTSIYLGQHGYRCANVALAIEVEPPTKLLAMPPEKVFGLIIDPARLADVRSTRQRGWSMSDGKYNSLEHITSEVRWSRRLFTKHGWRVLDVSTSAIEETAHKIIEMLKADKQRDK